MGHVPLPVVAQHVSCQIAHIQNQRVLHPFKSLATTSKQYQHPRVPALSRRQARRNERASLVTVHAVAHGEASELVAKGQIKYGKGDKMGALKLWEQALSRDPSIEDRQAALFNSTCVHAAFGDVEFAQVTLRDAINCGLDFEEAMQSSDYVKLTSSPQVIIQLRKFAQAAKRIKAAVGTEASAPQLAKAVTKGDIKPGDLSDIIGTEIRDGMDTSAFGILRRVFIIILVAIFGGTALFFLGLKFAFPEYR